MSLLQKSNPTTAQLKVALIGNPNTGKSTLFNRLTGAQQQIGNWPGVTVEKKYGTYNDKSKFITVQVVDLPGCYSLVATADMNLDEKITCEYIANASDTIYINVVDAAHLSRDLYLTLQLLELGVPVIIALNCMDLLKSSGINIDHNLLSQTLGCPVVPIIAKSGKNITKLRQAITEINSLAIEQRNTYKTVVPSQLTPIINNWNSVLNAAEAMRVLEGDILLEKKLDGTQIPAELARNNLKQTLDMPLDLFIAQNRREVLKDVLQRCVQKNTIKNINISAAIDTVVLHKVFGPLIFVAIMYLMFTFAINLGGFLQLGFDQTSEAIFIVSFSKWLSNMGAANWMINLLAHGIGKGINITVTFIPVLAAMFLSLGILESSGYMTRAAFIVDRVMRIFGLPGKAFVPMIVGFGCNVPAVMGARTLANRRERILTIMMTPFMSCSARLAIYAIFVTAFFPIGGQNIIFSLYVVGILVAVLTGFALRSNIPQQERVAALMEMSDYRMPDVRSLLRQVWRRLKSFLLKAGGLIILLCIVINGVGYSNLEKVGKSCTPIFAPMGISAENWPATVGLVTGLIAKEAVIGTLNSVYSEAAGTHQVVVSDNSLSSAAETEMVTRFGGATAAYAYLLFTLLYFPCVSVVAVIAKELNKRWALFSVLWSSSLAYIIAALYYQTATWQQLQSTQTMWILGLSSILAMSFSITRFIVTKHAKEQHRYRLVPTAIRVT